MIHNVTVQRSATPGELPDEIAATSPPPPGVTVGGAVSPGPIAWELPAAAPTALPVAAGEGDDDLHVVGRGPGPSHDGIASAGMAAAVDPAAVDPAAVPAPSWEVPAPAGQAESPWSGIESPPAVLTAAAPAMPRLGPVGRRRSVVLLAILGLLTLGLGTIAWFRRVNREMREFDPRMHVRPGRTAMAVAVPVLICLLAALAETARIVAARLGHAPDLGVSPDVTVFLLAAPALAAPLTLLLPMSIVATAMTAERLRVVEDRAGVAPDLQSRPVPLLGWLLLPGLGLVAIAVAVQRRLNRVWSATSS